MVRPVSSQTGFMAVEQARSIRPEGKAKPEAAVCACSSLLLAFAMSGMWIAGAVIFARAKVPDEIQKGKIMLAVGIPLEWLALSCASASLADA
jgi:hypothetical protein